MNAIAIPIELRNADKLWHLRRASLLKNLSLPHLGAVADLCVDRIYEKGETIFAQDDPADCLFILNRGVVRTSVEKNGKERTVGILKRGEMFGEDLFGPEGTRQMWATAHEESWVSSISRENLFKRMQQQPALLLNFIQLLNRKLQEAQGEATAFSFLDTKHRVAKTLLRLGCVHGTPIVADNRMRKLRIAVSHEQLASLVGGNRPHVSTIMSKFKTWGWILYEGRKLVINIEALERLFVSEQGDTQGVQEKPHPGRKVLFPASC